MTFVKVERERPAEKYEQIVAVICDICGTNTRGADEKCTTDGAVQWTTGYEVDETAIYHKTGFSCPDGGSGDLIVAHVCPDCFRDKLLPWLYSQDAIIHNQKWDW